MDTRSTGVGLVVLAMLAAVLGLAVYPSLPSEMAIHWNMWGEANGFIGKEVGVFMFPDLLLFVFLLWWAIPRIDPMKKNFASFRSAYNGFWLVLGVFLFYTFSLLVGANVGWDFNMTQALAPGLALLFAAIGALLAETKRNYFVGIRTPWTLSSDKIWQKTHHLASYLFYFTAVWTLAGAVFPERLLLFVLAPLLLTILVATAYSYIEFRRERV